MVGEGGEARSATDYGRPDRHERQCERDWGFETQHRHSSRSVTTARQQETRSRESGCSTTHSPMDIDDDHQMAGWRGWREHFHFHTTRLKRFSFPETPHSDNFWNRPKD